MYRKFLNSTCLLSVGFLLVIAWAAKTFEALWLKTTGIYSGASSLVGCWVKRSVGHQPEPDVTADGDNLVSLVALFETLPLVDELVLAGHIKQAWNVELGIDDTSESFVLGSAPLFVIKSRHQMYVVNYLDRNYFENVGEVLDEVSELRLSNAIRAHQAWISIDLVSDSQGLDSEYHYAMIGKLLSQMTNQDCTALLLPDRMKLLPWDDSVEAVLASGSPIGNIGPSQPPVIQIEDDNPELVAAVAISKQRFPQFVTAFENHQRDEDRDERNQFAVKAPITMGCRTESIWINTTAIENGILYGTLDNWPVELIGLCRGDRVRVAVSQINDWTYNQGAEIFGGFTTEVIVQLMRGQKSYS